MRVNHDAADFARPVLRTLLALPHAALSIRN
jgi:hypothetical protein